MCYGIYKTNILSNNLKILVMKGQPDLTQDLVTKTIITKKAIKHSEILRNTTHFKRC